MYNRMRRGIILLMVVGMALLVLVGSAAANARNGGGQRRPYGPAPRPAVGSGWTAFDFVGEGSTVGPFTFSSATPTTLKVTDAFCAGDRFRIYDNGVLVGDTSVPTLTSCDFPGFTDDPDTANASPSYSHATFALPPGAHSITVQVLVGPWGDGRAYIRIDGLTPPAAAKVKPVWWQNGQWTLGTSLAYPSSSSSFAYGPGQGGNAVVPLMCDWDGNGSKTPGVFMNGTWLIRNSNTAGPADLVVYYGIAGDVPVCGDWDGNGTETLGAVRGNQWYLRNSNTSGPVEITFLYGQAGDRFVVGDWNGDNIDTPGVYRSGTWFLRNSNSSGAADIVFIFTPVGGTPVVGDWDGDGRDGVGLVRGDTWFVRNSLTNGFPDLIFPFGNTMGLPLVTR